MARKDVDEYYNIISAQYTQLLEELAELEKDETIPEDIIEDVKRDIGIIYIFIHTSKNLLWQRKNFML